MSMMFTMDPAWGMPAKKIHSIKKIIVALRLNLTQCRATRNAQEQRIPEIKGIKQNTSDAAGVSHTHPVSSLLLTCTSNEFPDGDESENSSGEEKISQEGCKQHTDTSSNEWQWRQHPTLRTRNEVKCVHPSPTEMTALWKVAYRFSLYTNHF